MSVTHLTGDVRLANVHGPERTASRFFFVFNIYDLVENRNRTNFGARGARRSTPWKKIQNNILTHTQKRLRIRFRHPCGHIFAILDRKRARKWHSLFFKGKGGRSWGPLRNGHEICISILHLLINFLFFFLLHLLSTSSWQKT